MPHTKTSGLANQAVAHKKPTYRVFIMEAALKNFESKDFDKDDLFPIVQRHVLEQHAQHWSNPHTMTRRLSEMRYLGAEIDGKTYYLHEVTRPNDNLQRYVIAETPCPTYEKADYKTKYLQEFHKNVELTEAIRKYDRLSKGAGERLKTKAWQNLLQTAGVTEVTQSTTTLF